MRNLLVFLPSSLYLLSSQTYFVASLVCLYCPGDIDTKWESNVHESYIQDTADTTYSFQSYAMARYLFTDHGSSHHLDMWHVIFHLFMFSSFSWPAIFDIMCIILPSSLQFRPAFDLGILGILIWCLDQAHRAWWRQTLFLWSKLK